MNREKLLQEMQYIHLDDGDPEFGGPPDHRVVIVYRTVADGLLDTRVIDMAWAVKGPRDDDGAEFLRSVAVGRLILKPHTLYGVSKGRVKRDILFALARLECKCVPHSLKRLAKKELAGMRTSQIKLAKPKAPEQQEPGSPGGNKPPQLMKGQGLLDTYNAIMTVGADPVYMREVWNEMMTRLRFYDESSASKSSLILPT